MQWNIHAYIHMPSGLRANTKLEYLLPRVNRTKFLVNPSRQTNVRVELSRMLQDSIATCINASLTVAKPEHPPFSSLQINRGRRMDAPPPLKFVRQRRGMLLLAVSAQLRRGSPFPTRPSVRMQSSQSCRDGRINPQCRF